MPISSVQVMSLVAVIRPTAQASLRGSLLPAKLSQVVPTPSPATTHLLPITVTSA